MTRHILDQRDGGTGDRAEAFAGVERRKGAAGPHPNTEALQRRQPTTTAEETRPAEFARIERGERA